MNRLFLILPLLLLVTACDIYNQDEYEELVVVEAYLIAGRSLPDIKISTTLPVEREYSFENAALSGANIQVVLLDENGNDEEVFGYLSLTGRKGVYRPQSTTHTILPRRTYRLDIDFNNRPDVLTAVTTIPDQVQITNAVRDTVIYQSDEQLEILLAPTQKSQTQNIFVFDTIAGKVSADNLTPFYRSLVVDGDTDLSDLIRNSSGLINEANFNINPDGSILLKYPWIGVAFFEDNQVVTNSVDRNLTQLIRSQDVQLGGSTLSPGEIPNLVYNIEGGIGIFGSISSDTVQTFFKRP